ncbi:MAG: hypothetical protein WCR21_09460, partial [Bacteroidota bacterium]
TCSQPNLTLSTNNPNLTYTWSSTSFTPILNHSVVINSANSGVIMCTATNTNSGCTSTKSLSVLVDTVNPIYATTPSSAIISCLGPSPVFTLNSSNPSNNLITKVISPLGGTSIFNSAINFYTAYSPGTYSTVVTNLSNGCSTYKTFTVISSTNYPTFNLNSSPAGYTLGIAHQVFHLSLLLMF